ncbi:MAG: transposase [Chloroflexi bacterium]|nr:transposase [Chloroflexota bacterium]
MVSIYVTPVGAPVQAPPIVAELEALFARLPDAPLLAALTGSTRRGPKGHSVQALWHCVVVKYWLGLGSTDALIRELRNNPYLAGACGVAGAIPHKATFSRFFAKLSELPFCGLVQEVSRELVRQHHAALPGFGDRVAMDSTTIKAWSNGGQSPKADPDAGWAVKKNTHGKNEFTYGYKLHLLVDSEYELPIAATITPGNANDAPQAKHLLASAREHLPGFAPRWLTADKGYDGAEMFRMVSEDYGAIPVIDVRQFKKQRETRPCEAVPFSTPSGIRYRCHRQPYSPECPRFPKCPLLPIFADGELNEVPPPEPRYNERYCRVPYGSPEWKAVFRTRGAVERTFSRLKGQRALNRVTVRRLPKLTVHCYLSLLAMQVGHLVA